MVGSSAPRGTGASRCPSQLCIYSGNVVGMNIGTVVVGQCSCECSMSQYFSVVNVWRQESQSASCCFAPWTGVSLLHGGADRPRRRRCHITASSSISASLQGNQQINHPSSERPLTKPKQPSCRKQTSRPELDSIPTASVLLRPQICRGPLDLPQIPGSAVVSNHPRGYHLTHLSQRHFQSSS